MTGRWRWLQLLAVLWAAASVLLAQAESAPPQGARPTRVQALKQQPREAGPDALAQFNRLILQFRERMEGSLVRLEMDLPRESRPSATGVFVRPDVVVTSEEAVGNVRTVFGDFLGAARGYSALLEVRGSHRGVAVLQWVSPSRGQIRPVRPGSSLETPHGSLVLFLDAGTAGWPGVALPGALIKPFQPRGGLSPGGGRAWPLLGLKGPALGPEDQGGLVCDSAGRMIGLLQGRSRPFVLVAGEDQRARPGPGRGNLERVTSVMIRRAASFAQVIPVEQVMEAVDKVLGTQAPSAPSASGPTADPSLERPRLGITVDSERLVILRVFLGTPAQKSGLMRGDRITHLDREAVATLADLTRLVGARSSATGRVLIAVARQGPEGVANLSLALDLEETHQENPK